MTKSKNGRGSSWNLDHIVSLKNWPKLYKELEADLVVYEKWWSKLAPDMPTKTFVNFIEFDEEFAENITRLYDRTALMEDVDQKSAQAKKLKSQANDLFVKIGESTTKISHWLKGLEVIGTKRLDDKNAVRLFAAVPDLTYVLGYNRESAKHTLSEAEEILTTQKDASLGAALHDLRELIEGDFRFELKVKGKAIIKISTLSELRRYIYSDQSVYRQAAYEALLGKYGEHLDKFFLIYQAVVKNWDMEAKKRNFVSPIARRNFGNHVPDRAIEVLLDVVTKNKNVFQEFFNYKAKVLGVKKLSRFDVYAPLKKAKSAFEYSQALDLVLKIFTEFSPTFASYAKKIVTDQHIDIYPNQDKRSGAYCATVGPNLAPYVLLNFTNTARDVSTLAHELGHGVHSLYAAHHSISAQHANLPLSETASTLAEMLLFENLLATAKNPEEKKLMLADKLGDSFATILRQTYMVKFELKAHDLIGKGTTAAELSAEWLKLLKEQFGSSVEVPEIFKNEWACIPHIVRSPFYCYAYSFGELLSLALYARYKKEGQSFVPKIEKILAAGGSEDPDKVLKEVGMDMADPDFWQGSFDIIKGWVKELKK